MKVGFVGWRGMVGSVLLSRMKAEGDFDELDVAFFSTSQAGDPAPEVSIESRLLDATDEGALKKFDVIVTCQGGDYTSNMFGPLRGSGWSGFWVDAASTLRMDDGAVIVLDPVNRAAIDAAIRGGAKNLIGGNCTVALMLMGLSGLFRRGWIEWMSTMTYQAASGAGAKALAELVAQMRILGAAGGAMLDDPNRSILEMDEAVTKILRGDTLPAEVFGAPLAASLIPWVDRAVEMGQSREEWKGFAETNKILATSSPVPVDGLCVRVGALRCHSQAVTIKLTRDVPIDEINEAIDAENEWTELVPNTPEHTRARLTPAAVSGKLHVPVGRIHKLRMGPRHLAAFTVGDQLLWGAAEPLRRTLRILQDHRS